MNIIMDGVDVSKYQGNVDWSKVKASGKKFAMIRQGWINSDGSITVDPYYKQNMAQAVAAGVYAGPYLYSYARSIAAMDDAAYHCIDLLKGYKCEMPVALDFEHATLYKTFSKAQNTEMCKAFLDRIEALGFYGILYTYKSFAASYLDMNSLKAYDFWLAHYTTATNYTGAYGMWQYTSSGTVNGISGRVDCNHAYKDYPAIIKKAGLNGLAAVQKKDITVLQATAGDLNKIAALAESLGLKYIIV